MQYIPYPLFKLIFSLWVMDLIALNVQKIPKLIKYVFVLTNFTVLF